MVYLNKEEVVIKMDIKLKILLENQDIKCKYFDANIKYCTRGRYPELGEHHFVNCCGDITRCVLNGDDL